MFDESTVICSVYTFRSYLPEVQLVFFFLNNAVPGTSYIVILYTPNFVQIFLDLTTAFFEIVWLYAQCFLFVPF